MDEAKEITKLMGNIHPSRKISHQQVNYPETVQRLSDIISLKSNAPSNTMQSFPSQTTFGSTDRRSEVMNTRSMKLTEYQEKMKEAVEKEHSINHRKRVYNREVGRKAVVNQVLAGKGPVPKTFLFPVTASHEQILALTGTLTAPNPNIIPPEVPRTKKWLGENVGWES